jgi:hypothetical protein
MVRNNEGISEYEVITSSMDHLWIPYKRLLGGGRGDLEKMLGFERNQLVAMEFWQNRWTKERVNTDARVRTLEKRLKKLLNE